jgi:hypothetical protein
MVRALTAIERSDDFFMTIIDQIRSITVEIEMVFSGLRGSSTLYSKTG